jgi:tRNA U34 2-thiouridine synthase MnmA/TrmU
MAEQFELPTAKRKESMGICFVGKKRSFANFLGMSALRVEFNVDLNRS